MRKFALLSVLLLTMVSSVLAGTLAMYSTTIDTVAEGSVQAKEFIFVGEGTDSFQRGIKIAPMDTVNWNFLIKNYKNNLVTETDLYYKLSFHVFATPGKSAIEPLQVMIRDQNGNLLKQVTGTGTAEVFGNFPLSAVGQERYFTVEIHWPDGMNDIQYAGENFGTTIQVSAIASQLPLGGSDDDDGGNNPPQQKAVTVKYETTVPWQNGESHIYQYQYKVSITNHSATPINAWNISFTLPTDKLLDEHCWNAILFAHPPSGFYMFKNPQYNQPLTDNILPGQTVTFGGLAKGMGTEAIQNVVVSGSNISEITDVDLICQFGKASLD